MKRRLITDVCMTKAIPEDAPLALDTGQEGAGYRDHHTGGSYRDPAVQESKAEAVGDQDPCLGAEADQKLHPTAPRPKVEADPCHQILKVYCHLDQVTNHQEMVLQRGQGTLIVSRRPTNPAADASHYIPCEYCKAFYHEEHLWLHAKSCYFRPGSVDTEKNYVRSGRMMLAPFVRLGEKEVNELDGIIARMKETVQNPGLRALCEEDRLIREFGVCLTEKLGTTEEQRRKDKDNISTKLRAVARLLKKLNENKINSLPLDTFICGTEFKNVVFAVKDLAIDSSSPNLALTLGHYIKQICLLKISLAIQSGDKRKKEEAEDFKQLYEAHWNSKVSSVAHRRMRLRCINKTEEVPSTEDLVTLRNFLLEDIARKKQIPNPTYDQYVNLAQLVMVRILLFNKRRSAEVDELKIVDFERRIKGTESEKNTEIMASLEVAEKALLQSVEEDKSQQTYWRTNITQHAKS